MRGSVGLEVAARAAVALVGVEGPGLEGEAFGRGGDGGALAVGREGRDDPGGGIGLDHAG